MDFEKFFPSITDTDLRKYIKQHSNLFPGWTTADVDAFCGLVCRHSKLTIGAPTSPALSNALCYDLDVNLYNLCEKNEVVYTRYADDLFFSTKRPDVLSQIEKNVIRIVAKLKVPAKLSVNKHKTRHSSKRGCRRVTGIVLGSDGVPHIGRGLKRKIRTLIHSYDSLNEKERTALAGLIAYAVGFEPYFLNRLIDKYGLSPVNRAVRVSDAITQGGESNPPKTGA
jgi:RNA-directed DNA polymerase